MASRKTPRMQAQEIIADHISVGHEVHGMGLCNAITKALIKERHYGNFEMRKAIVDRMKAEGYQGTDILFKIKELKLRGVKDHG
jgi:hypothetical protein